MNDTLKVGDRVRIINIECPNSNPGKIIAVQKDPALPYCVEDKNGRSQWHYAKCLQKITDEKTTMQTENKYELSNRNCCTATQCSHNKEIAKLKLEVGKKYVIPMPCDNPCKLVAIDEGDYIFRDDFGALIVIEEGTNILAEIKEHREPYKHSGTYWFVYDPKGVPRDNPLDKFTGKFTYGLFDSKQKALDQLDNTYTSLGQAEITALISEGSINAI